MTTLLSLFVACANGAEPTKAEDAKSKPTIALSGTDPAPAVPQGKEAAVFAGGCFWCMEPPFDKIDGVEETLSGYTGGTVQRPSYDAVARKKTDHKEAIRVVYDPDEVTYERLLEVFWRNVDPTQDDGQFCDKGPQYLSAVFPLDAEQKKAAQASLETVKKKLDEPVVTTIEDPTTFWVAEDYHQDFYETNPTRYYSYRKGCGRDKRLEQIWGEEAGG